MFEPYFDHGGFPWFSISMEDAKYFSPQIPLVVVSDLGSGRTLRQPCAAERGDLQGAWGPRPLFLGPPVFAIAKWLIRTLITMVYECL